jgi:hypothetical protein
MPAFAGDQDHTRKLLTDTNLRRASCYEYASEDLHADVPVSEGGIEVGGIVQRRDSKDNWGTSKARNTIGGRRAAMRVVMDRLNGMVVVYESDSTVLEAGPRTLVFETQTGVSRLERFPEDWRRMSDEALLALRIPHS